MCIIVDCRALTTVDSDPPDVWAVLNDMEKNGIKPNSETYGTIAHLILSSSDHMELVPERWKQSISNQTESRTLEAAKMAIKEGLYVLSMLILL